MIILNGVNYDADIETMQRNYNKIEKYNVTTNDGKRHVKYSSVKKVLEVKFITLMPQVLESIKRVVCSTNPYITLTIIDSNNGDMTMECTVDSVGEETVFIDDDNIWWGVLEVVVTER